MSIAGLIRAMAEAGASPEAIALAVEAIEAVEGKLTAKREADRDRKRRQRDRDVTVTGQSRDEDGTVTDAPALSLSLPPQTPPTHTHTHPDITTRARGTPVAKPNGFARWWESYPNKVGKSAAEKSFAMACKRIGGHDPPSVLLEGLERAKRSRKWLEGYIPNPATWLNQGRWEDEPAEQQPQTRQAHDRPNHHNQSSAREDGLRAHHAGAMAALNQRLNVVG